MGLFEENSWGGEEIGIKSRKKLSQKRKKKDRKQKLNILNSETNEQTNINKRKRKKSKTDFPALNQIQEKESPQNLRKVQNKKKKVKTKMLKNNLTSSPSNIKTFKEGTNFSKKVQSKKKKLEQTKNSHSHSNSHSLLKKKSVQGQETNSQSPTVALKSKKRKLSEFEEELQPDKKRKKSKLENNSIQICEKTTTEQNTISEDKAQVSKNRKRKNREKKKKQIENIKKEDFNSNEGKNNELNFKININKLQEMLKNKKKEKKERKFNSLSLRERMLVQLRSSRFRFLNETFYNNVSSESQKYFKSDPDAFLAYHEGYKQQISHWPLNPLDVIITAIKKMPKDYIVADFGCGEANLADSVSQKVHSFDLIAMNDKVKACDMAHTPLLTNGVNVVVFCLSLMGTNLADYLLEANRVLKKGGIMKIAEVESRFDNVENFINLVSSYGFVNTLADISNDLFYFLDFKKEKEIDRRKKNLPTIDLKPCLYKKR